MEAPWRETRRSAMQDMQTTLERLQVEAANCKLIAQLATDSGKRALFDRVARHLDASVKEIGSAITVKTPRQG
jgi:hypothetical protein